MSRWKATYKHGKPLKTLIAIVFGVTFAISLGLQLIGAQIEIAYSSATYSDVLKRPTLYISSITTGVFAVVSLFIAWFFSGMAQKPTGPRGLGAITIATLIASTLCALVLPLYVIISAVAIDLSIINILQIMAYGFIGILVTGIIFIGPIAYPTAWFVGRWAERLERDARKMNTIAEHFT